MTRHRRRLHRYLQACWRSPRRTAASARRYARVASGRPPARSHSARRARQRPGRRSAQAWWRDCHRRRPADPACPKGAPRAASAASRRPQSTSASACRACAACAAVHVMASSGSASTPATPHTSPRWQAAARTGSEGECRSASCAAARRASASLAGRLAGSGGREEACPANACSCGGSPWKQKQQPRLTSSLLSQSRARSLLPGSPAGTCCSTARRQRATPAAASSRSSAALPRCAAAQARSACCHCLSVSWAFALRARAWESSGAAESARSHACVRF